jgi:hypothetical protein
MKLQRQETLEENRPQRYQDCYRNAKPVNFNLFLRCVSEYRHVIVVSPQELVTALDSRSARRRRFS